MGVQPTKSAVENRRSRRLPLSIPVRVYGRTSENQPFRDVTTMQFVSIHGGLLPLAEKVQRGQTILLVNGITDEERECRVVYIEPKRGTKKKVGVEFVKGKGDFWHVYDPPVEVRPAGPK
jgi:hypothetical protein